MSGVPLLVCVEQAYEGPFIPLSRPFACLIVEGLAAPADKVYVHGINNDGETLIGIFDINGRYRVNLNGFTHVWARREGGGYSSVSVWLD
jgi:hypothetical protein